jgi:hypothetical protein
MCKKPIEAGLFMHNEEKRVSGLEYALTLDPAVAPFINPLVTMKPFDILR